jgi:hypothetical protein
MNINNINITNYFITTFSAFIAVYITRGAKYDYDIYHYLFMHQNF